MNKHNIDNQAVTHYFNFIFKGYQYRKLKYFKLVTTTKKKKGQKKGIKEDIYKLNWELKLNISGIRQEIYTLGRFIIGANDIE